MTVAVVCRRRRRGVRSRTVVADATHALRVLGTDGELSIALVGDDEIRRLNASYRNVDSPTDVLAFSMREGADLSVHPDLLGDVVISLDTAARQAERRGVALATEVRVLLVHGILHLLGYDHERSPAEARRMFRQQRRLLARLDEAGAGRARSAAPGAAMAKERKYAKERGSSESTDRRTGPTPFRSQSKRCTSNSAS
jgi:probable rRNA maturation factor